MKRNRINIKMNLDINVDVAEIYLYRGILTKPYISKTVTLQIKHANWTNRKQETDSKKPKKVKPFTNLKQKSMKIELKKLKGRDLLRPYTFSLSEKDINTLNYLKKKRKFSRSEIIRYCISALRTNYSIN